MDGINDCLIRPSESFVDKYNLEPWAVDVLSYVLAQYHEIPNKKKKRTLGLNRYFKAMVMY